VWLIVGSQAVTDTDANPARTLAEVDIETLLAVTPTLERPGETLTRLLVVPADTTTAANPAGALVTPPTMMVGWLADAVTRETPEPVLMVAVRVLAKAVTVATAAPGDILLVGALLSTATRAFPELVLTDRPT
jgi:hypothetical protein